MLQVLIEWLIKIDSLQKLGFFGGSGTDTPYSIAVDNWDKSVYAVGVTSSNDFPFAGSTQIQGSTDWFLVHFSALFRNLILLIAYFLEQVIFSVVFGGSGNEQAPECDIYYPISSSSLLFIEGITSSADLPLLNEFRNSSGHGNFLSYLAAFNASGKEIVCLII